VRRVKRRGLGRYEYNKQAGRTDILRPYIYCIAGQLTTDDQALLLVSGKPFYNMVH
jgi:hypothetical protein